MYDYFTHVGIKFIPMRTSGGELIPESGVFVKISKVEVEEVQTSLRSARLRQQSATANYESDNPLILSTIKEGDEELTEVPEGVDVLQSINLLEFQPRSKSPSNPTRPVSSPPLLESASEHIEREKDRNQLVVTVDIEVHGEQDERDQSDDRIPSPPQESQSLVKPRSLTIEANQESNSDADEDDLPAAADVETGTANVREYHLKVRPQTSQDQEN